jgi:hypothetical protein
MDFLVSTVFMQVYVLQNNDYVTFQKHRYFDILDFRQPKGSSILCRYFKTSKIQSCENVGFTLSTVCGLCTERHKNNLKIMQTRTKLFFYYSCTICLLFHTA